MKIKKYLQDAKKIYQNEHKQSRFSWRRTGMVFHASDQ